MQLFQSHRFHGMRLFLYQRDEGKDNTNRGDYRLVIKACSQEKKARILLKSARNGVGG